MEIILLTGVGLLILIGLFTHKIKFEGVTEKVVAYLIPKDFRQKVFTQHSAAFSLMELLVVVTIIVILSAMLLPTLQKARGMAKYARWFGARQDVTTHPNCIAYYDFEGTGSTLKCQETLGVKNAVRLNGTIYGATRVKGGGRWPGKGALEFDGMDDFVDCGNDRSLNISGNAVTLSVWIKPDDITIASQCIATKGRLFGDHQNYGLSIYKDDEEHPGWAGIYWEINNGSRNNLVVDKSYLIEGAWNYLVGTYDCSQQKIYINGVEKGSSDVTGDLTTNSDSFRVGIAGNTNYPLNGTIDEVAIYNRALTPEEINQHYRGGRP